MQVLRRRHSCSVSFGDEVEAGPEVGKDREIMTNGVSNDKSYCRRTNSFI